AHRFHDDGVELRSWLAAAGVRGGDVAAQMLEPGQSHLRPPSVVHAQEQHSALSHESCSFSCGTTTSPATSRGNRNTARPMASKPPTTSATTNISAEDGLIPANVSVRVRAMVTAGLANDVELVNQ